MKGSIAIFLLITIILAGGCATFYANEYPGFRYSPTDPNTIPIYYNFPPQPYEVIGEIGANGAPASSWKGIGKRLKKCASQMGGDAIVIQRIETPYVGTYHTPTQSTTTYSGYSFGSISAYDYGGYTDGSIYGTTYGEAQTIYYPGTSIPMYGKTVRAVVIKFKKNN